MMRDVPGMELLLIHDVARIISSTLHIEEVYEQFTEAARKLADFDRVCINVFDPGANTITIKYLAGVIQPGRKPGDSKSLDGTATQHVFHTGVPLLRSDISADPRFTEDLPMASVGIRAHLMVPLISKGRIIGTMAWSSRRANAYGPQDEAILQVLAQLIAPAVENVLIYEQIESLVQERTGELTRSKEALARNEERYRLLLQHIYDFFVLVDGDAVVTYASPSTRWAMGYEPEDLQGKLAFDFIHPEDLQMAQVRFMEVLSGPVGTEVRTELRVQRQDGTWGWYEVIGTNLLQEPRVEGILANFHDVSERREALEREHSLRVEAERAREELMQRSRQVNEANQKLEEADRRKDEFLAMLSHELRNPLAPIRGSIDILQSGQGDPSILQGALNMLDRQVSILTRLVDDLLDVSRVTTGTVELQQTDLDLNALVNRVFDSFQSEMAQRGHQFTLSLPSTPLWVHGDETRLDQVVVNVLSNAAKFTTAGGQVWLSLSREGDEAVLCVRDTGIGMEAGISSEIFDLLFRGATSTDPAMTGGLGVGLSLVKSLVEMHGGTVSAHSEGPGRGSEFVVRLPLVEHSAPAPGPAEDSGRTAAPSLRILLVDDHSATTETYSILLGIFGHQVQTAYDGNSAIEAALGFQPDVVLLDLGLPGMDGYEVARRLRQEPGLQDTVLVAVTGYGQPTDRRRSQEAGFQRHLVKPMDIDELEQLLCNIAESGSP